MRRFLAHQCSFWRTFSVNQLQRATINGDLIAWILNTHTEHQDNAWVVQASRAHGARVVHSDYGIPTRQWCVYVGARAVCCGRGGASLEVLACAEHGQGGQAISRCSGSGNQSQEQRCE
jgi:hypothetical protein